jgi:hypothetical protein
MKSEEAMQPDATRSGRLVHEYQEILASVSSLLHLGVPETLLPASRDLIFQALCREAQLVIDEPLAVDAMRNACLRLACFLPYDEALAASQLHRAFERGDQAYITSPAATRTMARAQRIERDAQALAREFDASLRHGDHAATALIDEVDAFLAEMRLKLGQPG